MKSTRSCGDSSQECPGFDFGAPNCCKVYRSWGFGIINVSVGDGECIG